MSRVTAAGVVALLAVAVAAAGTDDHPAPAPCRVDDQALARAQARLGAARAVGDPETVYVARQLVYLAGQCAPGGPHG